MLDWKKWCRLCGNFQGSANNEPEIVEIIEQIFEVRAKNIIMCQDCDGFIRDFQNFVCKSRIVNEMFAEIEQEDESSLVTPNFLIHLRNLCNLPVPEIEIVNFADAEMNEEFAEIENYKLEEENEVIDEQQEIEYLYEDEVEAEFNPSSSLADGSEIFEVSNSQFIEEDEMDFQQEANDVPESTESTAEMMEEDCKEYLDDDDDINNHFEFYCHICEEKFTKMCFLTIHTKTEHNCLPRVACTCGKFLGSTKSLLYHYSSHVKKLMSYRCLQCKKCYKTETHYQNHLNTVHVEDSHEKKFTCMKCNKSFKEARHLTVHQNSHLPDELKFTHVCAHCDKKYSSVFSLRQHIKHIHVNNPTLKCPHCVKMFSRKANLDSHVNHVHTADRNYECDLCGLKVKTKGILRVHKKIHSTNPDDLLTCEVCQRQFKTKNQLTNHMVCHSDTKRHKCSLCPAEYKRSKELSSHIAAIHTGESKFPCRWCDRVFFNNSNYRKHKLKLHPRELAEHENNSTME